MHNKIQCRWCGWSGEVIDLDIGESDEPKYCPICGHEEFSNRYIENRTSNASLKKKECENCEW